jgi:hypothetical protein
LLYSLKNAMLQPLLQTDAPTAAAQLGKRTWSASRAQTVLFAAVIKSRTLAVLSAAVGILLAVSGLQVMRLHGCHMLGPPAAGRMQETAAHLQRPAEPVKLLYPVWWMAPFYTGSGELPWSDIRANSTSQIERQQVTQAGVFL